MRKENKKGFTLTELIVVIVIIGILIAVLIPLLTSYINRSRKSSDTQLVRNLNQALSYDETTLKTGGKHQTMQDALNACADSGFIVAKINATARNNEILWDSVNDVFCYLNDEKVEYIPESNVSTKLNAGDYRLWKISNKVEGTEKYSIYYTGEETTITLNNIGFDAGESTTVTTLNYNGNQGNNVVIRTNGGSLTVNDRGSNGKVYHYGSLVSAEITTDNNCFYSHGKIAEMTLKAGKIVAARDGVIALIHAQPIADATVEATKEDNGILYIPDGTTLSDVALSSENLEELGYEVSGEQGSETINGTAETVANNAYKISNVQELLRFRDNWNRGAITVELPIVITADLDITGIQWAPMGNWKYPFHGTINGNNHTIKGLTATQSLGTDGVYAVGSTIGFGEAFGFIGIAAGTININNINFSDVNISLSNGKNVGSLIAYAPSNEKFKTDGATFADNKWTSDNDIGTGLSLTIQNVNVSGKVEGKQHVGGVVGKIYSDTGSAEFIRVKNTADVTAEADNASGIVGYKHKNATMTFNDCHNEGDISAGASSSTGFAGLSGTGGVALITLYTNCSTTATCKLTGSGTNSLGKYNSDKTALVYQAHKANTELVGDFLFGGPSLGSQHQPTFVDPNND